MTQLTLKGNSFYKMIKNLFETDKLVLFGRIDNISEIQQRQVLELLESHYIEESIDYPGVPPKFHKAAATWSSVILFHAAQLVMYREHSSDSLINFFPSFGQEKSEAAIVTSDLCLRYLPSILSYLEQIDIEDELIPVLRKLLSEWHYSGLLSDVPLEIEEIQPVLTGSCLCRLYIDRVIENNKKEIGLRKEIKPLILSALGNHRTQFWNDFK